MIDRLPRCAAVATLATALAGGLLTWLLPVAVAGPAATLDQELTRGCAGAAVLAATWLWLGIIGTTLAALRTRTAVPTLLPRRLHRLVLAGCGVALAAGLAAGPASATPGRPHHDPGPSPATTGLPLPDRPTTPASDEVVVVAGDSLWSIARRDLDAGATAADVDARWRSIYARNRAVIGPDPDLILPAQRLEVLP